MSDQEYSARDKIVSQMTRDGLTEKNVTKGTSERVSRRFSEYSFDKETVHEEAFEGHSRFRSAQSSHASEKETKHSAYAGKVIKELEKDAAKSEKQIGKLDKKIARQEKKYVRSRRKATTLLPRIRIQRKEMHRTTVDAQTGKVQSELYKYGMYRPRFTRVIKKPANRFNLRERAVRGGKRKLKREAESQVFEGEGSENVGLEASHKVYRGYKHIHWYRHRKDYLKSKRHRRYRAYKENSSKWKALKFDRRQADYETLANRHVLNIARVGEEEALAQLTEHEKKMLLHEAHKKYFKKKYQKARSAYAAQHGGSPGKSLWDFIKKKDKRRREVKEAREAASLFGSILGGLFSFLALAAVLLLLVLVFMFFCASYVGTTDTDSGNITECDAYFSEEETKLREEILHVEEDRSGYDRYRYFVNGEQVSGADAMAGYIGHDSVLLSSFLAVSNNDYTIFNSAEIMQAIFEEMYVLEYREVTEHETGSDGEEHEIRILEIYLTVEDLEETVKGHMNENQLQQWELLNHTEGNQQIFSSPFDFSWQGDISSQYGWRIHPITGERKFHSGVDIAEPRGTEIHACSSGTVIIAKFSSSAGNYIAIEDKDGFVIKYMHCHELYVSSGDIVERGDVIAIVGTTGNSTGNHLHLQIEDPSGNTLNPLFLVRS